MKTILKFIRKVLTDFINCLSFQYSEIDHAKGLIEILSNEDPCGNCPNEAFRYKYKKRIMYLRRFFIIKQPCDICRKFIGLKDYSKIYGLKCPCIVLGKKEAIKRTWLTLEEKGYL